MSRRRPRVPSTARAAPGSERSGGTRSPRSGPGGPAADLIALQRQAGNEAVSSLLRPSAAQPLPSPLRSEMEHALGAPLGDVRIHAGAEADAVAQRQRARAFAVGRRIVFAHDAFDPRSPAGRELIAHELAHVVQQRRGAARGSLRPPGRAAERDAAAAAATVAEGGSAQVTTATGPGVARQTDDDEKKKRRRAPAGPKAKKPGKAPPPEPQIVGEREGVPIKRYPPGGKPPKQTMAIKGAPELPEGTHGIRRSPPGARPVKPAFEVGNWAHEHFERLEKIIKPEAERLTSERLRPGLRAEVEVPDPHSAPGRRPRMDRVDWQKAEIIELKPEALKAKGEAEAKGYADLMNKYAKRPDGKVWTGRCVTYNFAAVKKFLREKGYLAPDGSVRARPKKTKAKAGAKRQAPAKKPAAKKPTAKKPAAKKPATKKPAVKRSPVKQAPVVKPGVGKTPPAPAKAPTPGTTPPVAEGKPPSVAAPPVRPTSAWKTGLKAGGKALGVALIFAGLGYLVSRRLHRDLEASIDKARHGALPWAQRIKRDDPSKPVYMKVRVESKDYSRYVPLLGWMPESPVLHMTSIEMVREAIEPPVVEVQDNRLDLWHPGTTTTVTYTELMVP